MLERFYVGETPDNRSTPPVVTLGTSGDLICSIDSPSTDDDGLDSTLMIGLIRMESNKRPQKFRIPLMFS